LFGEDTYVTQITYYTGTTEVCICFWTIINFINTLIESNTEKIIAGKKIKNISKYYLVEVKNEVEIKPI
jgi:hypothetical protein